MKVELTYHAKVERIDRLTALIVNLELGEIILEAPDARNEGTTRCLTSTGIIFVKNSATGAIITGYMATISQVLGMYNSMEQREVPRDIIRRVKRNATRYDFLFYM